MYDSIGEMVGHTPLLRLHNIENDSTLSAILAAKIEYTNPAGSVKDRVALEMINDAEASGRLKPGGTIIEPTSGNTGLGLAAIGASLYYLNGGAELAWNTYGKLPDNGFNGIPVALLASNNPLGVIFSSVFLRFIDKGGYNLAGFTAYNEYVSDLIIALIIYFAGFSKLIKDMLSRRKAKKADISTQSNGAEKETKE